MRLDQFPLPKKPGHYWALGQDANLTLELCSEDKGIVVAMFYCPEEDEWCPYIGNIGGAYPSSDLVDALEYLVDAVDNPEKYPDPNEMGCECIFCRKRNWEDEFGAMDEGQLREWVKASKISKSDEELEEWVKRLRFFPPRY